MFRPLLSLTLRFQLPVSFFAAKTTKTETATASLSLIVANRRKRKPKQRETPGEPPANHPRTTNHPRTSCEPPGKPPANHRRATGEPLANRKPAANHPRRLPVTPEPFFFSKQPEIPENLSNRCVFCRMPASASKLKTKRQTKTYNLRFCCFAANIRTHVRKGQAGKRYVREAKTPPVPQKGGNLGVNPKR